MTSLPVDLKCVPVLFDSHHLLQVALPQFQLGDQILLVSLKGRVVTLFFGDVPLVEDDLT